MLGRVWRVGRRWFRGGVDVGFLWDYFTLPYEYDLLLITYYLLLITYYLLLTLLPCRLLARS